MTNLRTDVNELRACYQMMLRIRRFEEFAQKSQAAKLVRGAIHPYIGQEAIATGVCQALRLDDIVLSTHRGHGHALAKGASSMAMMAELFGRADGTSGGKGGSLHIADASVGMLGANGVVAANITIAAGAGHAIKMAGDDRVVACFFGDGAINRGPFLEGLNWAAVFELPVLFVCEDNAWSSFSRTERLTAGAGAGARARSLGLDVFEGDGNDVAAVLEATKGSVYELRAGSRPKLLYTKSYRLKGHTAADPALYRNPAEVAEAWTREPIHRCRLQLLELGVSSDDLDKDAARATAEMQDAYSRAAAGAAPNRASAYSDVQDCGDPTEMAF
jgi:TPP-dependent pyruvate/acetoin dehydrogenase alpha subunit